MPHPVPARGALLLLGGLLLPLLATVLAALPTARAATAPAVATSGPGTLVVSSPLDDAWRLRTRTAEQPPVDAVVETVRVDPTQRRQPWMGVGAALTDASVAELDGHPERIARLLDPTARDGARLQWLRLPLSATDASPSAWGWRETAGRWAPTGPGLRALAVLRRQVLPVAPGLKVVATPWTAPPSMKTTRTWSGGALREDAVPAYARLLVTQARRLLGWGVPLRAMTLGNEPGWGADYPSMTITDAQLRRLAALVGPSLQRLGVGLWGLDHNWSDVPRLDAVGTGHLSAVALHCYGGAPSDAAGLRVPWLVDECTGTTDGAVSTLRWDLSVLVRDAVAAGSRGLLMWNLALPPGYHGAFGGCVGCRGLLTTSSGLALPEPEMYVLAHLRRAASVGSRACASDLPADLPGAAFCTGSRVAVVAFNDADRTRWVRFTAGPTAASGPAFALAPGDLVTWSASTTGR